MAVFNYVSNAIRCMLVKLLKPIQDRKLMDYSPDEDQRPQVCVKMSIINEFQYIREVTSLALFIIFRSLIKDPSGRLMQYLCIIPKCVNSQTG